MLLQPDFLLIASEWHVNRAIINRRWGGKRSVLVKYDSRWGRVSWQVAIFQPLIWSPRGGGKSLHSGRTITSRCKDLIQQILGGSFQLPPAPSLPPRRSLLTMLCLFGAWNRCPWKIYRPHMWQLRRRNKKKKTEALPETWKSWTMWYIIIIGMAATGNIPLNIPEDNGTC